MKKAKKSVAVIGEGPTEWFYIDSLRVAMRFPFKLAPTLPQHSDIQHINKLIQKCLDEGFDYIVCLMDMDKPLENCVEMSKLRKMQRTYAHKKYGGRVIILESNPCTEFWFLLHFLECVPNKTYQSQQPLIQDLCRYLPGYEKTKKYFRANPLFDLLSEKGNLETASKLAETLDSTIDRDTEFKRAYTQIYKLFLLLNKLKSEC